MNKEPVQYRDHLLKFDLPSEELTKLADTIIQNHKNFEDKIASLPIEQWDRKTLHNIFDANMEFSTQYASCYFPIYVSSDKELKEVATAAKKKISDYTVESSQREDMYKALKQFQQKIDNSEDKLGLTKEELRWLEKELIGYKRCGLDLPEDKKNRMGEIKKRISELSTLFSKTLNDDTTKHAFTKDQLKGMSDDFINGLKKTDDGEQYYVSLQYPDLVPLLQKCEIEATRKQMDLLNGNKGGEENVKRFEETIELRKEQAELLGYDTFSDYALELRMAKKKENVLNFLMDLRTRLYPYGNKELDILVKLKEEYSKEKGLEFDGKINSWDFSFFHNLLLDREYSLDNEKIKEYFPIDKVTEGMFKIYQQILGLRFEPLKNFQTWHEDVKSFGVYDSQSNDFIGQFYLDMHPREGKYGHACVIGTQRSGVRADGTRQLPCCVMLCNFTKPTADKPSLLTHREVETYFHEFGHVMHNICTETPIHSFSCTQVERDFVEAPSQMLENWTYEEEPLQLMSGHFKDESQTLPKELLNSIVKAKNVNTGLLNLRQLFFGTFDMTVHTSKDKLNTEKLWADLRKEVQLIEQQPGTNPTSGFAHLMGGYESGYYGYLWSQVYSADMFEGGFRGKPLSPEFGMKYRKCILAPGGSKDGMELLKDFLGREPEQDAFLRNIGVLEDKPKL